MEEKATRLKKVHLFQSKFWMNRIQRRREGAETFHFYFFFIFYFFLSPTWSVQSDFSFQLSSRWLNIQCTADCGGLISPNLQNGKNSRCFGISNVKWFLQSFFLCFVCFVKAKLLINQAQYVICNCLVSERTMQILHSSVCHNFI